MVRRAATSRGSRHPGPASSARAKRKASVALPMPGGPVSSQPCASLPEAERPAEHGERGILAVQLGVVARAGGCSRSRPLAAPPRSTPKRRATRARTLVGDRVRRAGRIDHDAALGLARAPARGSPARTRSWNALLIALVALPAERRLAATETGGRRARPGSRSGPDEGRRSTIACRRSISLLADAAGHALVHPRRIHEAIT